MSLQSSQHVAAEASSESIAAPSAQASAPLRIRLRPTRVEIDDILALMKRMRRNAPVKEVVRSVIRQQPCSTEEIDLLIATLQNPSEKRWRERLAAAWALGLAPLDLEKKLTAARTLCIVLEGRQISASKRFSARLFRAINRFVLWAFLLALLDGLSMAILQVAPDDWSLWGAWQFALIIPLTIFILTSISFLLSPFIIPTSCLIDADNASQVRAAAARALGRLRIHEGIAELANAAAGNDFRVVKEAWPALHAVLSTLTADHYGRLGSEVVPSLCRALKSLVEYTAEDLLEYPAAERKPLSLLIALEKIGDGRAVPAVQRIVKGGWSERLRAEASRVLLILEERKRQENARDMLLRASSATPMPETLLRSASAQTEETPSDQLLRPHAPNRL